MERPHDMKKIEKKIAKVTSKKPAKTIFVAFISYHHCICIYNMYCKKH